MQYSLKKMPNGRFGIYYDGELLASVGNHRDAKMMIKRLSGRDQPLVESPASDDAGLPSAESSTEVSAEASTESSPLESAIDHSLNNAFSRIVPSLTRSIWVA
jgi:hypothetical protein